MDGARTSLDELRRHCAGQSYRALVELYTVRHEPSSLAAQIRAAVARYTAGSARCAERLYNLWNEKGQAGEFLELDCRQALDRVVADARDRLPPDAGEEALVRSFRLVTLGLALTASLFPDVRREMDVRTAGELSSGGAGGGD